MDYSLDKKGNTFTLKGLILFYPSLYHINTSVNKQRMEEEKRYAWIDLFRGREEGVIYDQVGVKEPFNEFFEGVMKVDRGKDILKYYKVSLNLIIFLTVQQRIREKKEKKKSSLTPLEAKVLGLNAHKVFHALTSRMPKPFVFSKIPPLSVPEERIENIKEIAMIVADEEIDSGPFLHLPTVRTQGSAETPSLPTPGTTDMLHEGSRGAEDNEISRSSPDGLHSFSLTPPAWKPENLTANLAGNANQSPHPASPIDAIRRALPAHRHVLTSILLRVLRGEEIRTDAVFLEDGFGIDTLQAVFKLFMCIKHNRTADEYYRKYETTYFLCAYYQERSRKVSGPITDKDINFMRHREGSEDLLPDASSTENFEIRVTDRKYVIILNVCATEFAKRLGLSRQIELFLKAICRTFLAKEKALGYFQDYSSETLLVLFSYIAVHAHKKKIPLLVIYETYREMGFISSYYLNAHKALPVSIEDLLAGCILETYNRLLPVVIRNLKPYRKPEDTSGTPGGSPRRVLGTPGSPGLSTPKGTKYILSPLTGRMSQILPVDSGTKRVLFKEQ